MTVSSASHNNGTSNSVVSIPDIPLSHLPLRPSTLKLLMSRGFMTVREVETAKQSSLTNLAAELGGIDIQQAAAVYREIVQECILSLTNSSAVCDDDASILSYSTNLSATKTALELVSSVDTSCPSSVPAMESIITFCHAVDRLLGGGVAVGELTEISGTPNVGKTQLAMQLAVNASLPRQFGGLEGQCIYIDTEGSFSPQRCYDMAQSLVQHVQGTIRRRKRQTGAVVPSLPSWFNAETILEGIHVYRVHDEAAQTAVISSLASILHDCNVDHETLDTNEGLGESLGDVSPKHIRLILIDSIAFHYRAAPPPDVNGQSNKDYFIQRTRSLTRQAAFLADMATQHRLAVVAMNQMTTKAQFGSIGSTASIRTNDSGANTSRLVPALGESWAHAVTTRIILSEDSRPQPSIDEQPVKQQRRICQLVKSPRLASGRASFQIVRGGIRGIDYIPRTRRPSSASGDGTDISREENCRDRHEKETDSSKRARTMTTGGVDD